MPLTNVNSQGSFNEPLQVLISITVMSIEMSGHGLAMADGGSLKLLNVTVKGIVKKKREREGDINKIF